MCSHGPVRKRCAGWLTVMWCTQFPVAHGVLPRRWKSWHYGGSTEFLGLCPVSFSSRLLANLRRRSYPCGNTNLQPGSGNLQFSANGDDQRRHFRRDDLLHDERPSAGDRIVGLLRTHQCLWYGDSPSDRYSHGGRYQRAGFGRLYRSLSAFRPALLTVYIRGKILRAAFL